MYYLILDYSQCDFKKQFRMTEIEMYDSEEALFEAIKAILTHDWLVGVILRVIKGEFKGIEVDDELNIKLHEFPKGNRRCQVGK